MQDDFNIEFSVIFQVFIDPNSVEEVTYPLNTDILRMEGKDLLGNIMHFTISCVSYDANTHKLVLNDSADSTAEPEMDFKL